jgi:hypothetical protein
VALFILHDSSNFSDNVLLVLQDLASEFAQKGIKLPIARMSIRESPSYAKMWNAHHLPHLRLYISEVVYEDLRAYPSYENIHRWVDTIFHNPDDITFIDSFEKVDQFNAETFAFYLRFPADQTHYIGLLRNFQKLDSGLRIYYANKAGFDPFEKYNPDDLVVGFRRNFDDGDKFLASESRLNEVNILQFFELFRRPNFHEVDQKLINELQSQNRYRSILFFENGKISDINSKFSNVANLVKQFIRCVHIDLRDEQMQQIANESYVSNDNLPQVRIVDSVNEINRVYEATAVTAEEIVLKVEQFHKGELQDLNNDSTTDTEL